MRLTRQTNYAIRLLMYCTANDGRLSRIPEIASAYSVSELFLFKILQPLVEHGLVTTVRGRNGGVKLGRDASTITLFDVVRVTEESFAMAECFENDASECPPTFNIDPSRVVGVIAGGDTAIRTAVEDAEDDHDGGADAMAEIEVTALDSVVGLSASGRTPFVSGALEFARTAGALTVAVACNRDSVIGRGADHAIEVVVGPEFIAGSTRLKAGTAQKLIVNMISTVTMVRLGKTYGNIMVDLRATNEKLRARAERIVMLITGYTADEAGTALEDAAGSVQAAVLMLLRGLSAEDAAALVASSDSLRAALARA